MKHLALQSPTRYNRRLYPKGHILALCGLAYILAACGQSRPMIVAPPVELTTCADQVVPPDLPPYGWDIIERAAAAMPTPSEAAAEAIRRAKEITRKRDLLMLDDRLAMNTAHGDCAAKIAGLRAWSSTVTE